jgi:hypothetical protein
MRTGLFTLLLCGVCGASSPAAAQRPPIAQEFDDADGETPPIDRAAVRPLPPIVTEYEPPLDEDEELPPIDEALVDPDDVDAEEVDAALARAELQSAMLEERRRRMAERARGSHARLLASPRRDLGSTSGPTTMEATELPRAIDRLELAIAGANAPLASVGVHDDGLRMRVGAGLDAFREPVGVRVRFEPLVVLQSDRTFGLPYDQVRVAFTPSITYRTPLDGAPLALFVGGAFEHVSDHTTSSAVTSGSGFAMTNQLLVRGGLAFDGGLVHGLARAGAGVHVLSDTSVVSDEGGEQSAELSFDLVMRSGSPRAAERNIQLCGAVRASYVAPNGERILEEAHLDLTLGACVREPTLGDLALVAEVGLGNEARWDRRRQTEHVGVALRWSL